MANPQLENGYTRIANELLEEIGKRKFTATQYKILLCIIRNTYGFDRKVHPLSATYIAKWANISVPGVKRDIQKLFRDNIIYCANPNSRGVTLHLGINKNYDSWNMSYAGIKNDTGIICDTGVVSKAIPVVVSEMIPNKRKNKENLKENIYCSFFENVWQLYPKKRGKSAVSKKAIRELQAAGLEIITNAIKEYCRECEGIDEQYIMNGSTFFNGRWKDYVSEQIKKHEEVKKFDAFERFRDKLSGEELEALKHSGVIDSDGSIDLSKATEKEMSLLIERGV